MAIYYLAGYRGRLVAGILGSLVFYASANVRYLPLLIALLVANYFLGGRLYSEQRQRRRVAYLWAGVFLNIGTLAGFKLARGAAFPLGLSYISFQLLSYLIDVYKGKIPAEEDALKFSFYVLLFPKILVGPIVRYSSVSEQISRLEVKPEVAADGVRRFIIGLAKKVLLADLLSKIVNPIFALKNPTISPGLAWLAVVAFALQLFFDFSGYTDMAIGIGKMMGLQFVENFNFPYISKSISEFWRRWHISLSSWFRDYVFFPLERRRLKGIGRPLNVLIVFALTGMWHGISWNYLIWGLIHGSAIALENTVLGRWLRNTWAPVQHAYTLGVVLVGWVFFRSPDLQFAARFLWRLAGHTSGVSALDFRVTAPLPIIDPSIMIALVFGIVFCLPVGDWCARRLELTSSRLPKLEWLFQVGRDLLLLLLFAVTVAASVASVYTPGIYDKF